MNQQIVWHPEVHRIIGESLYFFAIDTVSHSNVLDMLTEAFKDWRAPKDTCPIYLTYGIYDIIIPLWLSSGQYHKAQELLRISLTSSGGGTILCMPVDTIYYHYGCKVPPDIKIPILADHDLDGLDRAQRRLFDIKKFSKFSIGTVRPPKKITAFVMINQQRPDEKQRSKIAATVQRTFGKPDFSENLYGLYLGFNMCDVLLEIQVDDFDNLSKISEQIQSISLAQAKISTHILAKPLPERNDYCLFTEISTEGLRNIIAQKFPKMNDLNVLRQTRILESYAKFRPYLRKAEGFINALVENNVDGAANAIITIAGDFQVKLRGFVKKFALEKWKDKWIQELKSRFPKTRNMKDRNYEKWGLANYVSIFSYLNKREKWISKEFLPLIHHFIEIRNRLAHQGSFSIPLSGQEESLLGFLEATSHLPGQLKDF